MFGIGWMEIAMIMTVFTMVMVWIIVIISVVNRRGPEAVAQRVQAAPPRPHSSLTTHLFVAVLLIIGLLLTVGTGLFVASEFTLVNLDRADLEARQKRGETMLGPVIRALKVTSTHLSSAQLGITLTTLLTGFTLEPAC